MARGKRLVQHRYREDRQRWEVDYRDHQGRRHRPLFDTEQEVDGEPVADAEITFGQYATQWLAEAESGADIDEKTLSSYRGTLTRHVVPALGHRRLIDLTGREIKALLAAKRSHGYLARDGQTTKPYAPNTLRLIRAVISTVLATAVDHELLKANPAAGLRLKAKRREKLAKMAQASAVRAMTWAQRDAFLAVVAEHRPRYHALFAIMCKAGLRPGEACALKPSDIDVHARTVRIERSMSDHGRIKAPKTYEARTVDLSADLVGTLRRHLTLRQEEALKAGQGSVEWLFTRDSGALLAREQLGRVMDSMLRRAKLPAFVPYDCRHTFASLLLAEGVPITYVSAQMGHKDSVTTLKHYGHAIPDQSRRWVDVLDRKVTGPAAVRALEPDCGTKPEFAILNGGQHRRN